MINENRSTIKWDSWDLNKINLDESKVNGVNKFRSEQKQINLNLN